MSSRFEKLESETVWESRQFSVETAQFRHEDGEVAERVYVQRVPAVAIVAYDDERIWLVRQPREAIGVGDLLEIPAGKMDELGEEPLDTAKRELAEEIGKHADEWEQVARFWTTPGMATEECYVFAATGLSDADVEPDPSERIDIVEWPRSDVAGAIAACRDSKSLIGLYWLLGR